MNGVLLVDKPEGLTSADVVRVLKKKLPTQKVGHLGTLDPFASGLLPVCIGAATKIAQFLLAERKTYAGTLRLGIETATLDVTGVVIRTAPVPACGPDTLRELERRFSGRVWQTPPMYSALKKNGVPLYKLARRGMVVEREPRQVYIHDLALEPVGTDTLRFSLSCSKGTYVRTLAADIGATIGCGAHLLTLRRTAFGPFVVREAVPLAVVADRLSQGACPLLSLPQALRHYRAMPLSDRSTALLRRGQQTILQSLPPPNLPDEIVQLIAPDGALVALAQHSRGQWRLVRVL